MKVVHLSLLPKSYSFIDIDELVNRRQSFYSLFVSHWDETLGFLKNVSKHYKYVFVQCSPWPHIPLSVRAAPDGFEANCGITGSNTTPGKQIMN